MAQDDVASLLVIVALVLGALLGAVSEKRTRGRRQLDLLIARRLAETSGVRRRLDFKEPRARL